MLQGKIGKVCGISYWKQTTEMMLTEGGLKGASFQLLSRESTDCSSIKPNQSLRATCRVSTLLWAPENSLGTHKGILKTTTQNK